MVLEGLLNIAKGGMNVQVRSFERSAAVIANSEAHPDGDMTSAMLDSATAVHAFKANAAVYETGLEFWDMMRLANPVE